jgi:hypothetical protein
MPIVVVFIVVLQIQQQTLIEGTAPFTPTPKYFLGVLATAKNESIVIVWNCRAKKMHFKDSIQRRDGWIPEGRLCSPTLVEMTRGID